MSKASNRIIIKFVSIFFAAMLVSVAFITVLFIFQINDAQNKNIFYRFDTDTKSTLNYFSSITKNIKNVSGILKNKIHLQEFYINDNLGANIYIEIELKESISQSSTVQDILLYSHSKEMYYGIESLPQNRFSEVYTPELQRKFETALQSSASSWIAPYAFTRNGISYNYIAYIMPFEHYYTDLYPKSNLIFNYDINEIINECSSLTQYNDCFFYVKDMEQIVFYHNITEKEIEKIDTLLQNEETTYNIDGVEYYFNSNKDLDGLEVYSFVAIDELTLNSDVYVSLYWFYALISIVLGSVIIIIFVKFNYTPIFKLTKSFEDLGLNPDFTSEFFEEISETIQTLSANASEANLERLSVQRDDILFKLFNIRFKEKNRDDIYSLCKFSGINIDRDCYACVVLPISEQLHLNSQAILEDNENYNIFEYNYIHSNSIVLLFAMDEEYKYIVQSFLNAVLGTQKNKILGCGISTYKKDFLNIHVAYQEAYLAANYCIQFSKPKLHFKDIDEHIAIDYRTILRDSELLKNAITEKDIDKIMYAFNILVTNLNTVSNLNVLQIYCFEISTGCLDKYNSIPNVPNLKCSDEIQSILSINSEDAINPTHTLSGIMEKIIYEISEINQIVKVKLNIEEIKSTIDEQYLEMNFSIKQLADNYNTSISNLSHYFKSKENKNISDYISELKHNKVKQMLEQTEYTISYISEYVGYTHTSNFIKKFKSIEGVTPKQYRSNCKKDEGNGYI